MMVAFCAALLVMLDGMMEEVFATFSSCKTGLFHMMKSPVTLHLTAPDHGMSLNSLILIWESHIDQNLTHWRNEEPIPEAWRLFREQSDVKVDLSGCPMTAALEKKDSGKVTLAKT
ncbi:hypothetical protein NC653_000314 [Populus alba x Populus x berolinensis]|uniref:Uncharacterized protein n=1 Tax=Populus alba x Populus x berolinensis TaxID=444605 RepID=A0AAD6RK29_9ROSI|nr:hypothetical protein NC653_000314 [Populus alba x Populus x berolinensis]